MIGIVAGRIKEKTGKPAIVIAMDEDGNGKGSGRSISGVDLGAAILAAQDSGLLVAGGGHAMAAGLTVAPGEIEALADWLDERLAADVARAAASRALLLDRCSRRAASPALVDTLDERGTVRRRLAGPARRRRARPG